MMSLEEYIPELLALYPANCRPTEVVALGAAGGFSGACLWQLSCERGLFCLRAYPESYSDDARLTFIAAVLRHARAAGCNLVPVPLATQGGESFVVRGGRYWDLSPWMPGIADFNKNPSCEKLRAAMLALAQFHQAVESFPLHGPRQAVSPAAVARRKKLRELTAGGMQQVAARIESGPWPPLRASAARIIALFWRAAADLRERLASAASQPVPILPCIRDVWRDSVLFQGTRVTGLIDFAAMQPDTIAVDVARLLGSLACNDHEKWGEGLSAYDSARPLGTVERGLIEAFDRSTVVLGSVNWLKWIYLEGRQFADQKAVLARVDELLVRFNHLYGP